MGIVISADTGEVLDYVVMSKICELCKAAEKLKKDPESMKIGKILMQQMDSAKRIMTGPVHPWRKRQQEHCGIDRLESIDCDILIWCAMVTAKLMRRCGNTYGVCK